MLSDENGRMGRALPIARLLPLMNLAPIRVDNPPLVGSLLRLSQPDARAFAIFVDEDHTGRLEALADKVQIDRFSPLSA